MTAHIVRGKDRELVTRDFFVNQTKNFTNTVLDVGAGDGKGSLRHARSHPETLVIALDSSFEALTETSKSGLKKPAKGGAHNLICVYGNIKDACDDLNDCADLVRVYLPWGDLLTGIAEISEDIVKAISVCAKKESTIEFVINAEIWRSNLPKHLENIGEITPEFFISNSGSFKSFGIDIVEAHKMSLEEISNLDTTWSHKLMSSRESADFIMAKGVRI